VVHNLIINAVQAMPGGGSIRVSGDNVDIEEGNLLSVAAGPYIKISVRDRGVGIAKEDLTRIFDPYFTTKAKGSGLGLATSYSVVKKHGGRISVESEPGMGSVFHIYLPASLTAPQERMAHLKGPLSGKGRVLVMDDEEMVRQVVGDMLKTLGYEPAYARDGAEAIACYRSALGKGTPFDAVIMDLTIPGGMGGREAVGLLLALDPRARVIVASGYSNDPVMADFRAFGFSGVIAKPLSLDTLGRTLRAVLV
jgi:CheY-like chemotaxis protein